MALKPQLGHIFALYFLKPKWTEINLGLTIGDRHDENTDQAMAQ